MTTFSFSRPPKQPIKPLGTTTIGFPCPECGEPKCEVKDSRPAMHGIRRRRLCTKCSHRFTTMEMVYLGQRAANPKKAAIRAALDKLSKLVGEYVPVEEWDEL